MFTDSFDELIGQLDLDEMSADDVLAAVEEHVDRTLPASR